MNKYADIWTQSNCLSRSQLINYIRHTLDRDEEYLVESHLNDCALCSEALDGLIDANLDQTEIELSSLKKDLDKLIHEKHLVSQAATPFKNETKRPILTANKTKIPQPQHKYSWLAAASVLFLVGLGGYSVYSFIKSQEKQLAQNTSQSDTKDVEYTKPKDSNANEITTIAINPSDSFTPDRSLTQPKINKQSEPINVTEQKDENLSKFTPNSQNTNAAPTSVKAVTASPSQVTTVEPQTEDMAKDEEIVASPEMSNYANEKKIKEPLQEIANKKSSSVGLSNSKQNIPSIGSKELSFPTQQNNNSANQNDNKLSKEEIAASNSTKNKNQKSDYDLAMQYYNQGEYKLSIDYFENALQDAKGSQKADIQFQLAQAYLKIGKTRKAEKLFEILAQGSKYQNESIEAIKRVKK